MYLSHGSAWMPRVTPFFALNEMLFCTGPKSGRPKAVCFARCQFSLNHPRLSPCTGRSNTTRPGMFVPSAFSSFSKSISSLHHHQKTEAMPGPRRLRARRASRGRQGTEPRHPRTARLTGPDACNGPRSRPSRAPTTRGSRCTIRSSVSGRTRNPYASASSRARCAVW